MELELKHLFAYFPYSLRLKYEHTIDGKFDKFYEGEMTIIDTKHKDYPRVAIGLHGSSALAYFKPILKPMSKLTRAELEKAGFRTHIDYLTYELQEHKAKGLDWVSRLQNAPYKMIEYLCSKHYDIFGLLDVGLAVE